jgi:hypothetical protein
MVAAGNLMTDNAMVEEMSTALQSRMIHMEVVASIEQFVPYMETNKWDHRISSFLKFKPQLMYQFRPDHEDKTYASPRTWGFINRLLKFTDINKPNCLALFAGTISEGVAMEFIGFCRIYESLVTVAQIIADPTGIIVPREPSVLYALTGTIAANAKENTIASLMGFICRIPVEFQVVCLRELVRRDPAMLNHESVRAWTVKNATELF